MSNERPKSYDEFMALPIGGGFGVRTENGISVPIPPDVVSFFNEPNDLEMVWSRDGEEDTCWKIGRYRDGTWFRQEVL